VLAFYANKKRFISLESRIFLKEEPKKQRNSRETILTSFPIEGPVDKHSEDIEDFTYNGGL